ncbi:hypothetical protein [Pseudonocardia sp. ICBG601]|uniref:hypothetical protein n=1 Tax=Pseudonocardia sp. ICBG601 TaxID=2846759 RepID=UPI001CF608F4|nr:hypothetical protein [Pseudonocardia sp. ICBG601]
MLELGPDASLSSLIGELGTGAATDPVAVPALRRDHDEEESLLGALARLHVRGAAVDWAVSSPGSRPGASTCPPTLFQRERYWSTTAATPASAARPGPTTAPGTSCGTCSPATTPRTSSTSTPTPSPRSCPACWAGGNAAGRPTRSTRSGTGSAGGR